MILKFLLITSLVLSTMPAIAESSVTVLGLPLGGKFEAPKKNCTMDEIGTAIPRKFCWIQRFDFKGSRSGEIQLRDDKNLPLWALYSALRVSVGRDGILDSLTVNTPDKKDADDIVKSISSRFGPPITRSKLGTGQVVEWLGNSVGIQMTCHSHGCTVDFASDRERAKRVAESAARKAADAARPISP